jgi:hypothetical protein
VITYPDLPLYVYSTLDGCSWGMPELSEGTIGPYAKWRALPPFDYDSGWECPTWGPTVDGYGGCGTEEIIGAELTWRLDTVDVAEFDGVKKGVRIDPYVNKCFWYWTQGKVANIYARGALIAEHGVNAEEIVSVEPQFEVELHDMVPGVMEGTIADPGTDDLNATLCASPGDAVRNFSGYLGSVAHAASAGTPGWRKRRVSFGVGYTVNAVNSVDGWRWQITCSASWLWVLKNTGYWVGGTFRPTGSTFDRPRAGQIATDAIYGAVPFGTNCAGVQIIGASLNGSAECATGNTTPSTLQSWTCERPTEEIVRNLLAGPDASPPGHRLYRGPSASNVNWGNGLTWSYRSDNPIDCANDLFNEAEIPMTLVVDTVNGDAYANSYGLAPPATCMIQFSNE